MKRRIVSLLLACVLLFSILPQVFATSLQEEYSGGTTKVNIKTAVKGSFLDIKYSDTYSTALSGRTWTYTATDGKVTGPAYCVTHGGNSPTGSITVDTTKYTAKPQTMGAFANGYPQRSLTDFLNINSGSYPELTGLTEEEYGYSTQLSVWATLGQIGVEGTAFTDGQGMIVEPTDAAKLRVFRALQIILANCRYWTKPLDTGLHIRANEDELGDTVDLGSDYSLKSAAASGRYDIKKETINGTEYYTREYTVSSATSTYPYGYKIALATENAPTGTIFADTNNTPLEYSGGNWFAVADKNAAVDESICSNGSEYASRFKLCVPVSAADAAATGNIRIKAYAEVIQYAIYSANNTRTYEQSFIIADPSYTDVSASGYLKWGEGGGTLPDPETPNDPGTASVQLTKTDGTGGVLEGAAFEITGSGNYYASGISNSSGQILWTDLPADQSYTIRETSAPEGFKLASPVNVTVTAGQTSYVTISNGSEKYLRIFKQDAQNKYPLSGAAFRLEQIDGSFTIEGRTFSDGVLEFSASELPFGSYHISETDAPDGFAPDTTVRTVHWDGTEDVELVFTNVRKMGFDILKVDADTGEGLTNAVFDVYKDGSLITSVQTNEAGIATVSGLSEGYYECVERVAPAGYVLDTTPHGVHLVPYNPSTADDPILRITNRKMPSLRIVKYDAQTKEPIPNTAFEVYKDTALLGEFTTYNSGEIYLYDLAPGTYLAKEIATDSTHVINSTPQEIKLEAGSSGSLIFFNYLKPGIHIRKVDSQTLAPLANAKFRITQVGGGYSKEFTTDANGEIDLTALDPASYTVSELAAPEHYLIDDAQRVIKIEGGENSEFIFTNTVKPTLRIVKLDSLTGARLAGATYRIAKIADGSHYLDRVTDTNGEINISDMEPGVFSVQEITAPEGYVLDDAEYHAELFAGQMSQLVVSDDVKPDLRIVKQDADTGEFLTGATFKVKKADGATLTSELTDTSGEIKLEGLDPGVYEVIEQAPPVGYLPARQSSQLITLTANKLGTVIFQNYEKPTLTVNKISSVSGEPLQGAKFNVTYRSNNTETGSMRNLGNFLTDENGQFRLTDLTDGWYTITELESVPGYSIKEATQNVYIKGGEDKVLTFENVPLSALVIYKYDSVDGTAVSSAQFQVKKLTDTSGTGGTVIGTYTTGPNGSFTVTGLSEGAYIVEELASDNGHVIDAAPQTAYISGKQTDVVELYFGNSPKGSVLIKKIDAVTHEPLSDVEFLVTDSSGATIGNSNGKHITDSAGSILIDNLDPTLTLVVKETRAKENYVLDDVPQTIKVRAGHTVSLEFRNAPYGGLLIQKVDSSTKEPLAGAVFQIVASDGSYADNYGGMTSSRGRYTTDANGQIRLYNLKPDTYVVTEVEAPEHYVLNAEPQTVRVNSGDQQTLVFGNPKKGAIVLTKRDSVTGAPMEGVTFSVKKSTGETVGEYVTDVGGQITISDLAPATYVVTETATISGYVLDTTARNVVVKAGETHALNLTNKPKGNLVVQKIDSVTKEPLAGAVFRITTSNVALADDNEGLTSSTGLYTTDTNGQIYLSKLTPATYVVTEQTAPANYKLAPGSKTVVVRAADTQTVTITNDPLCTLTILKRDAVTKKGLAGAEFLVKYSDGTEVGSNNGRYVTGSDGTVTVSGLTPDATVVVSEQRAPTGYVKDDTAKTLVVRTGVANSLTFDDEPTTTLIIRKFIDGTAYEPLAGVAFKVIDGSGAAVGPNGSIYYTDEAGEIVLDGIEPGTTVTAREIKTVDGFVLNGNPQTILIKEGQVQALTFWNQRKGSLTIVKQDSVTKEPLAGVQFKVTYADGRVVDTEDGKLSSSGLYETDANGRITITGITGTLVVTETKTISGYTIDEGTRTQTVVVKPDDGQTLIFLNDPMQTLTIQKYVTGSTTPIQGVEFLVTDSSGAVVGPNGGEFVTDEDGRIVISGLVPGTTITARETKVPSGYVLSSVPKSIRIKEGEAQQMTFFNDSLQTVVIQKFVDGTTTPLAGVTFLVTDGAGNPVGSANGEHTTDENGRIVLTGLTPGMTLVAKEVKTAKGYVLNGSAQTIVVGESGTTTATTPSTGNVSAGGNNMAAGTAAEIPYHPERDCGCGAGVESVSEYH